MALPIARLLQSGYDMPNADELATIDVNYEALLTWLLGRQKLPKDWHKRLEGIRAKAAEAAKELRTGELQGAHR